MTDSTKDVRTLTQRLREFAQPDFYPFDEVRDEKSTNRQVMPGLVRIAEVPMSAKKLMAEAAARISELEGALRPFAEFAKRIAEERPGWDHDAFQLFPRETDFQFVLAPFRKAAAIMLSAKPAHLDEMMKAYEDLEQVAEKTWEDNRGLETTLGPLCDALSRLRALKEGTRAKNAQVHSSANHPEIPDSSPNRGR